MNDAVISFKGAGVAQSLPFFVFILSLHCRSEHAKRSATELKPKVAPPRPRAFTAFAPPSLFRLLRLLRPCSLHNFMRSKTLVGFRSTPWARKVMVRCNALNPASVWMRSVMTHEKIKDLVNRGLLGPQELLDRRATNS
ncbi:hypothetical protein SEVIR_6G074450v4 [Setaria viridis]